jgi:hypothetical protein
MEFAVTTDSYVPGLLIRKFVFAGRKNQHARRMRYPARSNASKSSGRVSISGPSAVRGRSSFGRSG